VNTRIVRLGSVCTVVSGSTPRSEVAEYWDGDVKWITPAELTEDSYIITDSVRHITSQAVHDTSLKPFPKGTVILSSRAPIGKTAIAGCEMYCNQGFKNLICSSQIDPKYLYSFLSGKTEYLNSLGRGATFKEISKSIVENIEIPLPELAVQRQISLQFEHIRTLVRQYREQLHLLEQIVKSRFIEMFGDPVRNPKGWPVQNFEDISILITDGEHATPRRSEKGIYLLSARNVLNHALQLEDVDFIDEDEYSRIARRVIPQEGDVLISCSGSIGRCCVVPANLRFQMVRSAALIRFSNAINPIYAEWLITSDELQRQIEQSATQSSQANLFQGKIQKLHGYVPPKALQDEFALFVTQTDKSKFSLKNGGKEVYFAVKYIWESLCRGILT